MDRTTEISFYNSYDNTSELLPHFSIRNPTPVTTPMEKNIQNRLLNGFANYNLGYDAWKAWGEILYTEDSLYNLHGAHLTLAEYQLSQQIGLQAANVQLGDFHNMIICGDWCAIRYDMVSTDNRTGQSTPDTVMEFVNFRDYGGSLGTRVVEGWACSKGPNFEGMSYFQTDAERAAQQAALAQVASYEIPETDDLQKKYPVLHPTPDNSALAVQIKKAILQDFDVWNHGSLEWGIWADKYYLPDYVHHIGTDSLSLACYKKSVDTKAAIQKTNRLYFDSLLISGDWAAIHYRIVDVNVHTGEKEPGDVMQFLHFVPDGESVKIAESWTK